MAKIRCKCWYPESGKDILDVVDDMGIFICLKDRFGNTIHNKNLASFTYCDKKTDEKTKYVLLRPIESYGDDDEGNFVFKNRILYRVDEVEGRHVLVKETDSDRIMSVHTRYYKGMMDGEIPMDSLEYREFYKDVYDMELEDEEYDFGDDGYGFDGDEDGEDPDGDSEKKPIGIDPTNDVGLIWMEGCDTDIADALVAKNPYVYICLKNEEGESVMYLRAAVLECDGKYYTLLSHTKDGKLNLDDIVAFRIDESKNGKKGKNHVLVKVEDRDFSDRLIDGYRNTLAEREKKDGK